jgi:hypothetical protein
VLQQRVVPLQGWCGQGAAATADATQARRQGSAQAQQSSSNNISIKDPTLACGVPFKESNAAVAAMHQNQQVSSMKT